MVWAFLPLLTCRPRFLPLSLCPQIDPEALAKSESSPLLEIQVELVAPDIVWKPELGEGGVKPGVRDMIKRWLQSFLEIGQLMKRLDVGEGNYAKELEEDYEVYDALNQVGTCASPCKGTSPQRQGLAGA